jgi:hypothetical protein
LFILFEYENAVIRLGDFDGRESGGCTIVAAITGYGIATVDRTEDFVVAIWRRTVHTAGSRNARV